MLPMINNSPVYFIVTTKENINLGYNMRGDFLGHTRGTRDLEKVREWKESLESKCEELKGFLHIMSTPTFVLDEKAELSEVK